MVPTPSLPFCVMLLTLVHGRVIQVLEGGQMIRFLLFLLIPKTEKEREFLQLGDSTWEALESGKNKEERGRLQPSIGCCEHH